MAGRSVRHFEQAVLGAPMIPPGRLAAWTTSLRRRLLSAHRQMAPPPLQILEALFATFDAHVLRTLVELDIPDQLLARTTVDDLADRVGADPARLERVLRYASARGMVGIDRRGRLRPNRVTAALRRDAPAPWRGWVQFATAEWFDAAWRHLPRSLEPSSPPAFELAHGTGFFEFTTDVEPSAGAVFDRAMSAGATLQGIVLARSLDWKHIDTVCDVGGGNGSTLQVLQRYHGHLDAILFDLPEVVERSGFATSGGQQRHSVGGSFFESLPAGQDRYLLLAIVHDWDDDRATDILTNLATAMGDRGEAIVVETVATSRPRDDFASASDLLMLVLATGRERTGEQYGRLFAGAGLRITDRRLLPTGATAFILRVGQSLT